MAGGPYQKKSGKAERKNAFACGENGKALMGMKPLLVMKEEMNAEDEEELHDLINKMERECQRFDLLLSCAHYQYVPVEKCASRAGGTKRQTSRERKR